MIGLKRLKELVETQQLFDKPSEHMKDKKGAPAFDVRIGSIHEFAGDGFLGIDERKTPDTRLLGEYKEGASTKVTLQPGKYYVFQTVETIKAPKAVGWHVIPRSTLYRSGLLLLGGLGDPGYHGKITGGMINLTDRPFILELGARVANVAFFSIEGDDDVYIGTYHGGKTGVDES